MPDHTPRCADCRFRSEEPHMNLDHRPAEYIVPMFACKRRAPVVTGGMMSPPTTIWPTVTNDDWCGEHQERTAL